MAKIEASFVPGSGWLVQAHRPDLPLTKEGVPRADNLGTYPTFDAAKAAHPGAVKGVDENGNDEKMRRGIARFER